MLRTAMTRIESRDTIVVKERSTKVDSEYDPCNCDFANTSPSVPVGFIIFCFYVYPMILYIC